MKTEKTTEQARLEGVSPHGLLPMFANQKLARSLMDSSFSMRKRWFLVKSERDIQDITQFYRAKDSFFDGCIGGIIARESLEWIAKNRDKKLASLGTYYKSKP